MFKHKAAKVLKHINFRLSGQKIPTQGSGKYIAVTLQDDLNWEMQTQKNLKKLRCAVAISSKIRNYTPKWLIQTICFSIFDSN